MSLNCKEISISLIIAFCVIFSTLLAWKTPYRKTNRTHFLWKLMALSGLFFSIGLAILVAILPQSPLNILSWIIYDFLISFVLCLEIPAYLRISKYDEKLVGVLKDLRSELIKMRFSFAPSLESLKKKKNENASSLKEENVDKLLDDFITSCDKMNNLDVNLWNLTLNETSSLIDDVTKRSKHPFPKLIDILALSGLSILLAQLLKLLG